MLGGFDFSQAIIFHNFVVAKNVADERVVSIVYFIKFHVVCSYRLLFFIHIVVLLG